MIGRGLPVALDIADLGELQPRRDERVGGAGVEIGVDLQLRRRHLRPALRDQPVEVERHDRPGMVEFGEAQRDAAGGDEEIVVPAGTLRTLHLRAPGVNTTELWLAYDYLLLPVKIRHVDNKGNSLVQVATEIQLSQE